MYKTNRWEMLDHFAIDLGLADTDMTESALEQYINDKYGGFDDICPEGGECFADDPGASLRIFCRIH